MERDFYTDEFEQLIKEKADQFRMYPSKRVWHSIYNNLHPSRRWPSFVISILFFTSLVSIGYLNTSDPESPKAFAGTSTGKQIVSSVTKTNDPDSYNTSHTLTPAHPGIPQEMPVASSSKSSSQPSSGATKTIYRKNSIALRPTVKKNDKQIGLESNIYTTGTDNSQLAVNKNGKNKQSFQVDPTTLAVSSTVKAKTGDRKNVSGNKPVTDITASEDLEGATDQLLKETPKTLIEVNAMAVTNSLSNKEEENQVVSKTLVPEIKTEDTQEKSWIEHFAFYNKKAKDKWKSKLDFELYATPAVNYRKLTTDSKGSVAPFATTGDINKSISQKPGLGIESGVGLSYAFAKNLRLKAGLQFNYTNYNINADQINHPVQTSILLTDPITGYSYPAARSSSIANAYDDKALSPITLHNRTYQISLPVGLAYKLSSNKNVEWFIGATAQPSYIFGGKAHLISSDLQNYISDPSSIRNWNLNIGIETFMTYKLGTYSLRVGPQVRYQVYSTYRKNITLIEKPYAVGLKFGIVKGF